MIFLKQISIEKTNINAYPFNLPLFKNGFKLNFKSPITIIVGENGCGKSTLLESLAQSIGFNTLGGNRNHSYQNTSLDNFVLADKMKLIWSVKQNQGFFFRAETFFEFAKNLDEVANYVDTSIYQAYGGKSLQKQSHGEGFLSLFQNKFSDGVFILDEPESALSPDWQLSLISILTELTKTKKCQFIIATHSPLLISLPNAILYEVEEGKLVEKNYKLTKQFKLYKDFTECPERYLKHLTK